MKTPISSTRCITIVGPSQSGKTSLMESILHVCKQIPHKGHIKENSTLSDHLPEEHELKMSISMGISNAKFMDEEYTFIDCPGSSEFINEFLQAIRISDLSIVVIEPIKEKILSLVPYFFYLNKMKIPHVLFINKVDNLNFDIKELLGTIQEYSLLPLVIRQIPIREGDKIIGAADVIHERAYAYTENKPSEIVKIPEHLSSTRDEIREKLLETLADFDDALMEKILDDVPTSTEEIYEHQQLVISTNSMPKEDWVKTRAFCWMSAFLHFDKIMQIPFILLHKLGDITYRELIEVFTMEQVQSFTVLSEINDSFINAAKRIQNGGSEFCESKKWLNLFWPDDELQLINLCTENRLEDFYFEAEALLNLVLKEKFIEVPKLLLHEAIQLNQSLIKHPFQKEDLEINFSYNIWEFYQNQLIGVDIPVEEKPSRYLIDRTTDTWSSWEQWCQEVIWYGNKKGAYLYKLHLSENTASSYLDQNAEEQIEGHY